MCCVFSYEFRDACARATKESCERTIFIFTSCRPRRTSPRASAKYQHVARAVESISLFLTLSHSLFLSLSFFLSFFLSLSLCLLSLTLSLSLSLSVSSLSLSLALSLSLSLWHLPTIPHHFLPCISLSFDSFTFPVISIARFFPSLPLSLSLFLSLFVCSIFLFSDPLTRTAFPFQLSCICLSQWLSLTLSIIFLSHLSFISRVSLFNLFLSFSLSLCLSVSLSLSFSLSLSLSFFLSVSLSLCLSLSLSSPCNSLCTYPFSVSLAL